MIETAADRLIAHFKLEQVVEFVTSIVGLTFIVLGTIGAWRGWW